MGIIPQKGERAPDYLEYFKRSRSEIDGLLATYVGEEIQQEYFIIATKAFFVEDGSLFGKLSMSISQIQADAAKHLGAPDAPRRRELDRLRRGEALSLFAILRMHHCFQALSETEAASANILRIAGLERGLPNGSIVPSIWRFNRSRYSDTLFEYRIQTSHVSRAISRFAMRPRNPDQTLRELTQGYLGPSGARIGAYRVTAALASVIAAGLADAIGQIGAEEEFFERVFDPAPNRGPGNGTMTQALPTLLGNLVSVQSAREYSAVRIQRPPLIFPESPPSRDREEVFAIERGEAGTMMRTREGFPAMSFFVPQHRDIATIFWPHRGAEAPFVRYFQSLCEDHERWNSRVKFYFDDRLLVDEPDGDDSAWPELLPVDAEDGWESGARAVTMELSPSGSHSNHPPAKVWYATDAQGETPEAGVSVSPHLLQHGVSNLASLIARTHHSRPAYDRGIAQALRVLAAAQDQARL